MRNAMEDATEGMSASSTRPIIPVSYMYDRHLAGFYQEEDIDGGDPVTRAMRKADALYERTASLDLSDLSIPEDSTSNEMPLAEPTAHTGKIEYGEARVVQMQPAIPTTLKRVKSADRWYTKADRKSLYAAPLTPPRSYSTRTVQTDNAMTPEDGILTFPGTTPSFKHEVIGNSGSTRLPGAVRAAQLQATPRALPNHTPPIASHQTFQPQEDLIISLADAQSDPVLQYATDNLLYDGTPVHFCSANRSMQGGPHDDGKTPTERLRDMKTQNALRTLLADLLPAPHDYDESLFTEVRDTQSLGESIAETSVGSQPAYDLVLAVGGQDTVRKELYQRITGELQALGQAPTGSRSMRIDLGQLIASAMQSYTSQPLASQTKTNPFTDSFLLAHLLIAEMKQALVGSSEARYIILDFTTQNLPIVFAMRSIMGPDIVKIAGIVNDEQLFQDFKRRRTRNRAYKMATAPEFQPNPPFSPSPTPSTSIAEADFLISSSAGEAEEAIFINAVWKHLIRLDDSYAPKPDSPEFDDACLLPIPSSLNGLRNVRFHAPSPDSPPESPPGRTDHQQAIPPSPRYTVFPPAHQHQATRPVSPDPTIASRGSSRSKTNWSSKIGRPGKAGGLIGSGVKRSLSKLFSRKAPTQGPVLHPAVAEMGIANHTGFQAHGDEEDDVDAEERRLVPLFDRSRVYENGGSAKALRMLGID
ncbi:hypothetical protein DL546_001068 [Coniochaeta pulveracea]|uniref:Uncharacterized protein n=1 Tax=Coniochaeta pulveracea TaxID=177199 RepID=A0A420XYY8_9PEZI|nr:hypothetical protein DL546_001068 [Coniochaeta pulveracea]